MYNDADQPTNHDRQSQIADFTNNLKDYKTHQFATSYGNERVHRVPQILIIIIVMMLMIFAIHTGIFT